MKRHEIDYLLRRIVYINRAVIRGKDIAIFYVGKRKEEIKITKEVLLIKNIIDDVKRSQSGYVRMIIEKIEKGFSDEQMIMKLPMSKNMYYRIKREVYDRIYQCCISQQLVEYDEILMEEIK